MVNKNTVKLRLLLVKSILPFSDKHGNTFVVLFIEWVSDQMDTHCRHIGLIDLNVLLISLLISQLPRLRGGAPPWRHQHRDLLWLGMRGQRRHPQDGDEHRLEPLLQKHQEIHGKCSSPTHIVYMYNYLSLYTLGIQNIRNTFLIWSITPFCPQNSLN